MPHPRAIAISACLCALLSLSCDGDRSDLIGPSRAASLVVHPFTATLETGETIVLKPVIHDWRGIALSGRPVTWSTSDPEVASITSAGRVTAGRPGSATITAVADEERATTTIVVLTPVSVVEITPDSPTIVSGTSVQLTARVLGPGGRVIARVVSWTTSDPAVATVSVGKVRGLRVGFARIEATAGNARGATDVTVVPNGEIPVAVRAP
jgi:trimeric autotransporter adhesin